MDTESLVDPDSMAEAAPESVQDTQELVQQMCEEAILFYETFRQPDEVQATDYYFARPFGNERENRSQVVSHDLHDTVRQQLPSLLRIFAGPEHVVHFNARNPEDEPEAKWKTEAVNWVVWTDNHGFLKIHSVLKDALVRRLGIAKAWYEPSGRIVGERYTGLNAIDHQRLLDDPTITKVSNVKNVPDEGISLEIERMEGAGKIMWDAVAPDEFFFTPNSRSLDDAPLVMHGREVSTDYLIGLGYDPDEIDEHAGVRATSGTSLSQARQVNFGLNKIGGLEDKREQATRDEANELTFFAEAYVLVDTDDDGISERRLFRCVGPNFHILPDLETGSYDGELVDDVPFALFTADPEPHTILGLSDFDLTADIQLIKSQMLRGMMNSLAKSIDQKTGAVVGKVNMSDLSSSNITGIVRMTQPNMLQELTHKFIGGEVLESIAYMDETISRRVGISKEAAGLDADALQSTTKAAVAATMTAAQQQLELLARVFGETGFRRLYILIAKLLKKHQRRALTIRLYGGQYQEIDPRSWTVEQDVVIDVGIGQGTPEDRLQRLLALLQVQKEALASGAPFVNYTHIRNTLQKLTELSGWRNSTDFFDKWGKQEQQAWMKQMAQQPKKPDPETALAQVEEMKTLAAAHSASLEYDYKRWVALLEDRRERDLSEQNIVAGVAEAQARSGSTLSATQITESVRAAIEAAKLAQADRHHQDSIVPVQNPEGDNGSS